MSRRLDEIEENLRRRDREERRAREAKQHHEERLYEAHLVWREHIEERRSSALETINELGLGVVEREEPKRVERVRRALASWLTHGGREPIDVGGGWTPADYWVLRRTLYSEGGGGAYQRSAHWRQTSSAQRERIVFCERCGTVDETRHAHHIHYETVGCERVGIDLVTLCGTCHLEKEHGPGPSMPGAKADDEIPF